MRNFRTIAVSYQGLCMRSTAIWNILVRWIRQSVSLRSGRLFWKSQLNQCKEKALYYADMGGSLHTTREELRSMVLGGEEGVKACQSYIMSLVHTAALTANNMVSKKQFSHKETIEAYHFAVDILKRLYSDGNVSFYAYDISYYYSNIAFQYAEMNDVENTLRALEESCKYAVVDAGLNDMDYTAPMVNRLTYKKSQTYKNYKGNTCNLRMKDLDDKRFDFVRQENAFTNMVADLEKYAE